MSTVPPVVNPVDEFPSQNLYQVLNVPPTASAADLKKALNRELRLWSNRTNAPQIERRQEAERMVKLLEQAETILLDAAKRTAYDRKIASMPAPGRELDDGELAGKGDLVQEARRLLSEGEIPDALYVAEKATQQDGNNADAWAVLAQARFRWGDTEDAIYEYKRAIKLRPNEASYYFDFGSVLESADRPADAMQQYQRASQVDPGNLMYRAGVGAMLVKLGRCDEAVQLLEQCVKEEPSATSYQWFLAIAYADMAHRSWTYVGPGNAVPEGYYATSKAQVREAQFFIAKAMSLKHDDDELRATIARTQVDINQNIKRRFDGSYAGPIIAGIAWSCLLFSGLVMLPLYFFAARPPQYAINKRVIKPNKTVAGQVAGHAARALASVQGTDLQNPINIAVTILTILAFPIVILVKFIQNYTGENAL